MLEYLRIKNIALIDSAEVQFKKGLNIISGETGAGKSVVIEAIGLLLGGRARLEWVRAECDEGIVEGVFNTSEIQWITERLRSFGFQSGSDLIIKRTVHRGGKHRISINGELATLTTLQRVCDGLIDLCGQHEHQSLLKASVQLDLLDRFGDLCQQATEVTHLWSKVRDLQEKKGHLQSRQLDRNQKVGFLKFQMDEISFAELKSGEDDLLLREKVLLQSAHSRALNTEGLRCIVESENGALDLLRSASGKLKGLLSLDDRAVQLEEPLETAVALVEEFLVRLERYVEWVDSELNAERLQTVQDRLSVIADLRRKYGKNVEELLQSLDSFRDQLSDLEGVDDQLQELVTQLALDEQDLKEKAIRLSHSRSKVAKLFSSAVTSELKDLKMEEASFVIDLHTLKDFTEWGTFGADVVQFLIQTNRGESSRPLGKVASGGELSRIMLSIRRVISDRGGIGVYLFDEIDAGMGGQTAFEVGKKLKSVAIDSQVICITHLPQVAAFADHHLAVQKFVEGKRTLTAIQALNKVERKKELARMLGGPQLTRKSLGNASELMQLAQASS